MIYIIRHGQTELNSRKVLQGRSDCPLSDIGIEQVREAAERLAEIRFDAVYSSPLVRAVQTAQIVAPNVCVRIDERLIEMDYGPYEGMPLDNPAPEIAAFFADFAHNPAPDGMEQLASVVARAADFMEECCRTDGNILVSTHAIAMKGILEYLTPASDGGYWSRMIRNCEVYTTEFGDGVFAVPEPLHA